MRRGREEESKIMSPMFPRLHVNDADKGGPRAPPRNKMALYEQLSVPSQRFKHAAVPTFSISARNVGMMVPSSSLSQSCGNERSMLSSYCSSPQTPSFSTERDHSLVSDGKNTNFSRLEMEKKTEKHMGCVSPNALRHLQTIICDLPNSTNSYRKECEDDDDFRVPTFVQSDKDQHANGGPYFHDGNSQKSEVSYSSSMGLPKAHESPSAHSTITDLNSKKHEKNSIGHKFKENVSHKEQKQRSTAQTGSERNSETCNVHAASYDKENAKVVNNINKLHNGRKRLREGSNCKGNLAASRCLTEIEVAEDRVPSRMKKGYGSKTSNDNSTVDHSAIEDGENLHKSSNSMENDDAENNELSEMSMVDSDSGFDISPDDVVAVIGPKHFWKARRAIVNQQRVFAVQVFELHRLIKVQKLIAASPELLLKGNSYLRRSSKHAKVHAKSNSSDLSKSLRAQTINQKDDSQNVNNSVPSSEDTPRVPPPQEDGFNKICAGQVPLNEPYGGNPIPIPMHMENRTNPWCLQPHGNQWLIPVMSPSEGLVYKPFMGSFPPAAGFMAPIYGGYGPIAIPPVSGDFMNAAYEIPASHQQQIFGVSPCNLAGAQHYFPSPYGLPIMHHVIPAPAVEQANPLNGTPAAQSNGHVQQNSHSSCNTSNAGTDRELHGSSASSLSETIQEDKDESPCRPATPTAEFSDKNLRNHGMDGHTRVIKVVPHNARSATESAARIFQVIQEQRQHG